MPKCHCGAALVAGSMTMLFVLLRHGGLGFYLWNLGFLGLSDRSSFSSLCSGIGVGNSSSIRMMLCGELSSSLKDAFQ